MKWYLIRIGVALLALSFVTPVPAGDWKYPLGITYSSGFDDVLDYHEAALGVDADFSFPIGVSFHPYIEINNGHMIGIDVGPLAFIWIGVRWSRGDSSR